MTNLSQHFTLEEMCRSNKAVELGIENKIYSVNCDIGKNLVLLAESLELLRAGIGPVGISSGYRCPELNIALRGVKESAHCLGLAADIEVDGLAVETLFNRVAFYIPHFDQLINEYAFDGHNTQRWVHVSVDSRARGMKLIARRDSTGKTQYFPCDSDGNEIPA